MGSCRQRRLLVRARWLLGLLLAQAVLLACGDDDADATDAATPRPIRDGAVDASPADEDAGPPAPVCDLDGCDLLDPDACGAGTACVVAIGGAAGEASRTECMEVGSGGDGASCRIQRDCAAGLH